MSNLLITISILFVLIVTGCGKQRDTAEFEPYVTAFEELGNSSGYPTSVTNIRIERSDDATEFDSDHGIAKCQTAGGYSVPTIKVYSKRWDTSDESFRQSVIDHELGHCVLGREHDDSFDSTWECPASVMSSKAPGIGCFAAHKSDYGTELFSHANMRGAI